MANKRFNYYKKDQEESNIVLIKEENRDLTERAKISTFITSLIFTGLHEYGVEIKAEVFVTDGDLDIKMINMDARYSVSILAKYLVDDFKGAYNFISHKLFIENPNL